MTDNLEFLYLSQQDVIAAGGLEMRETLRVVEKVFSMMDKGQGLQPHSPTVGWEGGEGQRIGAHFGALDGDLNVAGVKWTTVNPTNPTKRGRPSITNITVLSDPQIGLPLATMDGTLIGARRTGAISGVAAKYLARPESEVIGLIGLGVITRGQITALREVLPQIKRVKVFDINAERAEAFAREMGEELSLPMEVMGNAKEAVVDSDVVAVATFGVGPADSYVEASWIKEGSLFNIMSSHDAKGEVIAQSDKAVVDAPRDLRSERRMNLFYKPGLKNEDVLYLGEIINGKKPGRESDQDKIYFKSWGMSVFDVAEAYRIYQRAKEEGIGQTLELWQEAYWL
jgi:ornithine cyclodeaminase